MNLEAAAPAPHSLLRPRIVIPFFLVALIWGSTWLVIKDQISDIAPSWSITYRFIIATTAMFIFARLRGHSLALGRQGQMLAIAVGLAQFCGNFNFVYRAEIYLTSGIVAVMFGLLMVPNAIFGRLLLGQPITARFFAGSLVALCGIAMLLVHEARITPVAGAIGAGILLTIGGILSASIANVIQAGETGKKLPLASLLAWSMLYGTMADAALAWTTAGAPTFDMRWEYGAGVTYLALFGSVVTFPLYYNLVREIGAGRAAYNGVVVVIVAMVLSTLFEGYVWTPLAALGSVLSLAGMVIALRARSPVVKSG
ncbi:DMT family transporter [Altererythrobacter aquiaggeris]|uniref:DMT family transporter n=1 Tax=Aestuarierythrobacter aquiaggeris TaxID=1898396 RepID=UPI003017196E